MKVRFEDRELDTQARRLRHGDEEIPLTPKAFQLLELLVEKRPSAVSKSQIHARLWPGTFVAEVNLATLVWELRRALADDARKPRWLRTVRGYGYALTAEAETVDANVATAAVGTSPSRPLGGDRVIRLVRGENLSSHSQEPGAASGEGSPSRGLLVWWASALSVLAACSIGAWSLLKSREPLPPITVPVTSDLGLKGAPALSPDGRLVAFVRIGESGDRELHVKQVAGGESLAVGPRDVFSPAWSPDGERLAFLRVSKGKPGAPECAVHVIPALGGAERRLATSPCSYDGLSWSADGSTLALALLEPSSFRSSIYLLSLDTGQSRRLTSPSPDALKGDWNPRFSPDGETVAFQRGAPAGSDIHTVSVEGGEVRRVTFGNQQILGLDWAADGKSLLFAPRRPGRVGYTSLWRVSASRGEPEPLGFGEQSGYPTVARGSARVAYLRLDSSMNLWRIGGPSSEPRNRRPELFIASSGRDYMPRHSPDGTQVLFSSTRSGSVEIWLTDSDRSIQRQLTRLHNPMTLRGVWSPSGEEIAFWSQKDGNADIYVTSVAGGPPRRLTSWPTHESAPSWSNDGRSIYFSSNRTGRSEVWRIPAEGGDPVQITHNRATLAFESPDGADLYLAKQIPAGGPPGIWRMPIAGGEEELLLRDVSFGDWTLGAAGLVFFNRDTEPGAAIDFLDFATGEVSRVARLDHAPVSQWLSVSPDGRWIVYVRSEMRTDIMLVENFR